MITISFSFFAACALQLFGGLHYGVTALLLVFWGLICVLRPVRHRSVLLLMGVALLLRSVMLTHEPLLSDDIFRALWEGKLVASGGNPYLWAPAAFEVMDGVRERVNHANVPSVYPPMAQWLWALCASLYYHPLSVQLVTALIELTGVWALADLCREKRTDLSAAWMLALHPLAVVEGAGSGHIDSVAVSLLIWAFWCEHRGRQNTHWLILAGGCKLLPWALLFNGRWGKWSIAAIVVLLLGSLPLMAPGIGTGLMIYAEHWSFQGAVFPLLVHIYSPVTARLICGMLWGTLLLYSIARRFTLLRASLWLGGAFLVLSPTVHPWYALWVFAPALVAGWWSWAIFASLLPLSYTALSGLDSQTGEWSPSIWPAVISYTALCACLLLEYVWRLQRPGPSDAGDAPTALRWLFRMRHASST